MEIRENLRQRKIIKICATAAGIIVVGFATWMVIGLANQKTDLEVIRRLEMPEFASLEGQFAVGEGNYAVAVDGEQVAGNESAVLPTASTAKMILGLAVMQAKPFEVGSAGETIALTDEDYDRYVWYYNHGGSNTAVQPGEEISEYEALMSVFLASSNNMADTLAAWAFGSLDNYREYATKMLGEWGINETTIGADASGFEASTTSTARDLAQIGAKVLENPVLAEIVGTKSYTVPVAGLIENTNQLLGQAGIVGIKTGYIGEVSGYCLVAGYLAGKHIMTTALMGAESREASFGESLDLVVKMQELLPEKSLVKAGDTVGYYDSWWTGQVKITAEQDLAVIGWAEAEQEVDLEMDGPTGVLKIKIGEHDYEAPVRADEYNKEPSFGERLGHLFGWAKTDKIEVEVEQVEENEETEDEAQKPEETEAANEPAVETDKSAVFTNAPSNNCTVKYGALMLINPNFSVENDFIAARRGELISLSANYGINELNAGNGDNLLDAEAAGQINKMIKAYEAENPGHTMGTLSCFRSVGTNCGRLCAATGTSDHHTGLTCDLVDPAYGMSLDTSTYDQHPDWQWLKANSYKYGFIDRFPEAWAGGSMDEPVNVDANGSTGLFETWHYRYVGVGPATEIATGKYNNGQYDSLEHYLLARGMVSDLKNGTCK